MTEVGNKIEVALYHATRQDNSTRVLANIPVRAGYMSPLLA